MYHRALKLIRQYHRLSQVELAERLCLSNSFISELEKKDGKRPSMDVLEKYSNYFKIPMSSLILFAERTDTGGFDDKTRIFAADKVLKMLEWLEQTTRSGSSRSRSHGA
jgi:transcriptional regulator with XRE-family HTH domain